MPYRPNVANTTFYENNGDFGASGFIGSTGFDGQLSYAFSDYFYLLGSGSFTFQDSNKAEVIDYEKHYYYEGGLGFYSTIGTKGRFTFHFGMGKGTSRIIGISNIFGYHEVPQRGKYFKYFIQSTMGFSTSIIDFGGSVRYNYVDFYQFQVRDNLQKNVFNHFFEPAFFIRAGWRYWRTHVQLSIIDGLRKESPFSYDYFRVSVGFSFKYNLFGKNYF